MAPTHVHYFVGIVHCPPMSFNSSHSHLVCPPHFSPFSLLLFTFTPHTSHFHFIILFIHSVTLIYYYFYFSPTSLFFPLFHFFPYTISSLHPHSFQLFFHIIFQVHLSHSPPSSHSHFLVFFPFFSNCSLSRVYNFYYYFYFSSIITNNEVIYI